MEAQTQKSLATQIANQVEQHRQSIADYGGHRGPEDAPAKGKDKEGMEQSYQQKETEDAGLTMKQSM